MFLNKTVYAKTVSPAVSISVSVDGTYNPSAMEVASLALASRDFRRAPLLAWMVPTLTDLSIILYASEISFSTGSKISGVGEGAFLRASRARKTFFIRVDISDFLDLWYIRFTSACFALFMIVGTFFGAFFVLSAANDTVFTAASFTAGLRRMTGEKPRKEDEEDEDRATAPEALEQKLDWREREVYGVQEAFRGEEIDRPLKALMVVWQRREAMDPNS